MVDASSAPLLSWTSHRTPLPRHPDYISVLDQFSQDRTRLRPRRGAATARGTVAAWHRARDRAGRHRSRRRKRTILTEQPSMRSNRSSENKHEPKGSAAQPAPLPHALRPRRSYATDFARTAILPSSTRTSKAVTGAVAG